MVQEKSSMPPAEFNDPKIYVWVKGLEGKVNNLLREVNVLKNDFIKKNNKLSQDLKTTSADFLEMKHEQEKVLQKMDLIIKELKQTAGIEEVMTIKKYLEFWNPLNFVTQRDLERAVENRIDLLTKETHKETKEIKEIVKTSKITGKENSIKQK
ncbi:MAG: hypothetical protein AABW48_02585 [Nanoarchaeota archaeon]